jgi:radical SAM protein with 4Fe4S-binding SPASM domain
LRQLPREKLFRDLTGLCRPLRAQIELTRRCNLDCVHCSVKDAGAETDEWFTQDRFRMLLRELAGLGVFHVNITGGEPFARPDAAEMLKIVFDENFYLSLQTNGTLLRDEDFELLEGNAKRIRQIGVSLYGTKPPAHEAITRVPGSHALTTSAILRLKAAGLRVVATSVITNINYREFFDLDEFCRANDIALLFSTLITKRENGDGHPLTMRLDDEMLCSLPKPWETFIDDAPGSLAAPDGPDRPVSSWCSMGTTSFHITAWGEVRPCSIVRLPAGSLRNSSMADIWFNSELFARMRSMRAGDLECFGCESFPSCRPCPGIALMEHGSLEARPRELCRINSVFSTKIRNG